jgi:hypothetical protein
MEAVRKRPGWWTFVVMNRPQGVPAEATFDKANSQCEYINEELPIVKEKYRKGNA